MTIAPETTARRWALPRFRLSADDRLIATLAVPALGALAAEPLYVLVDTAIVGHLGVSPLAALALAGAVLSATVGLCNFLAYASTPKVGRLHSSGQARAAAHLGRQTMILAIALGVLLAIVCTVFAGPMISVMGGSGHVRSLAVLYMRIAAFGLPFALIAIAGQGYLRGVSRLRLPLVILLVGNGLNAALEVLFVFGLRLGVAGSAWATLIAQAAMAAGFLAASPHADRNRPRVDWVAMRTLASTGGEIFIRTGSLFAAFLVAGAILARVGAASLAAHQIAFQLWIFLALALDALAIAAQVMVSQQLGTGGAARARALATRTLIWSVIAGVLFAGVLIALAGTVPHAFTDNRGVLDRAHAVWPIFALMQPVNAAVFVLDGILIGAGDTHFLMWAMVASSFLVFAPLALASSVSGYGIVGVWSAILAFVLARLVSCGLRFRGDRWAVSGATR